MPANQNTHQGEQQRDHGKPPQRFFDTEEREERASKHARVSRRKIKRASCRPQSQHNANQTGYHRENEEFLFHWPRGRITFPTASCSGFEIGAASGQNQATVGIRRHLVIRIDREMDDQRVVGAIVKVSGRAEDGANSESTANWTTLILPEKPLF
jgi:hypothetical protein